MTAQGPCRRGDEEIGEGDARLAPQLPAQGLGFGDIDVGEQMEVGDVPGAGAHALGHGPAQPRVRHEAVALLDGGRDRCRRHGAAAVVQRRREHVAAHDAAPRPRASHRGQVDQELASQPAGRRRGGCAGGRGRDRHAGFGGSVASGHRRASCRRRGRPRWRETGGGGWRRGRSGIRRVGVLPGLTDPGDRLQDPGLLAGGHVLAQQHPVLLGHDLEGGLLRLDHGDHVPPRQGLALGLAPLQQHAGGQVLAHLGHEHGGHAYTARRTAATMSSTCGMQACSRLRLKGIGVLRPATISTGASR